VKGFVERQPLKKLEVDGKALLKLLNRWREGAKKAGHCIERVAVAFEAGRDGFWLDSKTSSMRLRKRWLIS
jgi:transposase